MAEPQIIEVAIPDGVGPGDEFLVEFDGTQFNIGVPDGCGPGMMIQVEVPAAAAAEEPPAEPEPEPEPAKPSVDQATEKAAGMTLSDSNSSRGGGSASSGGRGGTKSSSSSSSSYSKKPVYSSFDDGFDDPPYRKSSPFDYDYGSSYSSYAPKWEPEPSVFDGGFVLAGEHAEKCGDFMVGQLVQVTRSDGSWTYGKVQEYDEMADNYTVLTKMGPKYFVERADLTDDIVTNPSDGSCAQQ